MNNIPVSYELKMHSAMVLVKKHRETKIFHVEILNEKSIAESVD